MNEWMNVYSYHDCTRSDRDAPRLLLLRHFELFYFGRSAVAQAIKRSDRSGGRSPEHVVFWLVLVAHLWSENGMRWFLHGLWRYLSVCMMYQFCFLTFDLRILANFDFTHNLNVSFVALHPAVRSNNDGCISMHMSMCFDKSEKKRQNICQI